MQIRVLGPVEVEVGGRSVQLGGPKQRSVLALLALHANSTVSVDELIEGLWGDDQPASATKMVQLYVSQLRKLLGEDGGVKIVTHGRGYELRAEDDGVDARRFERLIASASRTRANGGGAGAAAGEALTLWRGPPLADLSDEPFADAETRRLQELHLAALELSIESELEAGGHLELVGRLETLAAEHPLSERLQALRMLALYRAGRQAEALEAYRSARTGLVEEVGVEPGPELRRLHEAILRHDPALELVVPDTAWTRRETEERVGDEAERAAEHRGKLRRLEAGLASDVADLAELHRHPTGPGEAAADERPMPVCPFKGLASFEASDADYFFGRERLAAEIVARLVGARVLAVVGPSGSGKSSVVRAGLLPALARGVLPGSERWRQVLMRPGEHPLAELGKRLGEAEPGRRVLLAIDQFEETFTACRDPGERAAFTDALVASAQDDERPATIVLALRADYYGACAAHPALARALGEHQVLVGPMQRDELARAISAPARAARLDVEPELVDRLVDDVAGQPGGLPLLSTALLELWQHRDGRAMRLAAYERTGGVDGAVARLAEQAYGSLTEDDRRVARRILMRLAGSGEGDAAVRRRVSLDELEVDDDAQASRVLDVLADSRLVTVGGDAAEVAHEALLREWPRLRNWIEEDAEGRRLHRHITLAARDWDAGGRDAGGLLRGARLTSALDWELEHGTELNRLEYAFLDESRRSSERESERSRTANRRLCALLAGAIGALAIAVAAGLLALSQRGDARDAARTADAQRLGAEALTVDRLDHALLLARTAVGLDDSTATRGNLLSVLLRNPAAAGVLRGDGWPLYALAVSPDERLVATGDERGGVMLFDTETRRPVGPGYALRDGLVQTLAFSPDGAMLAVAGHEPQDAPPGALVDLITAPSGQRRARFVLPAVPGASGAAVAHVAFLPGGSDMIVQQSGDWPDGPASVLRRLDASTGTVEGPPLRLGSHSSFGLSATGDRRRLFVTNRRDDATWEIDAERLRVLRRLPVGDARGAVSHDGKLFALGSTSGGVRLLDVRSGEVRRLEGRHSSPVVRLAFTPDGRTLVSSAEDGDLIAWDVERGAIRESLTGHDREPYGLAVSRDGRTLYSAALDGRTLIWDLAGDRRLGTTFTTGAPFVVEDDAFPKGIALDPDGRTLAVTQSGGSVDLLDARTLQPRRTLQALSGFAAAVDFSPDGRLIAVTGEGGRITLWDSRTARPAGPDLRGLGSTSQALAFSPDGGLLAAAGLGAPSSPGAESRPGAVMLWDVRRRSPTGVRFRATSPSLAFSPDGRMLAAAGIDRPTEIRDPRTGRLAARLRTSDEGRSVAFSPDGRLLATGLYDGRTELWSTETWKRVGPPLEGHTARVISLEFVRDGRMLATSSADGTVLLWDMVSRKPIGAPLTVEPNSYVSAALTPDDAHLFAVSEQGPGVRWEITPEAWKQHACRIAGRDLTEREWSDALPGRPYRAVCRR